MKFDYSVFLKPRSTEMLYGIRLKHSNSLYQIKNNFSFKELCEFADTKTTTSSFLKEKLFGNPLPTSYESLGFLGKRSKLFKSETIENEINWTLLCIRHFKFEIALFNEYRILYEKAFLTGDYEKAEEYLTNIETEICFSVWSLENRMVLLEAKESPEAQKTFLSEINKVSKGFFIPYLSHFISNRSEKGLSVSRYESDLKNALQKLKGDNSIESREYYYFKLSQFAPSKYLALKDVLTFEGYHSVVDRYLTLVTAIKMWLSDPELEQPTKIYIIHRVQYLIKKFPDKELLNLVQLYFPGNHEKIQEPFDLDCLDLFTSGLYEESISKLRKNLFENPSEIEYYKLYVLSHIYSNKQFELPTQTKCFQNTILNALNNQLNRKIDPYESQITLQRLIKNLQSFEISKGLHKFFNEEILGEPSWIKFDMLSVGFNNPEVAKIFDERHQSIEYLNYLQKLYPNSISIQLNRIKLQKDYDIILKQLNIPKIQKLVEHAKYCQFRGLHLNAKEIWEQVVMLSKDIVPINEIAIRNLFSCYVDLGLLDNAVQLYVESVLVNDYLVYGIDATKIHEKLRKGKFKNVTPNLDLALFYTFSRADENELHIAYERFNQSIGIERPSQLSLPQLEKDRMKWIHFLHLTCSTEIFKHSIYINGSKDGYSERILVCKLLLSLDESNESLYKSEINSLTDTLIIQEGLQHLDESKIYVNEQGLINSELREFEGLYNRYKTIANIYKESNKELVIIDQRRGVRLASMEDVADSLLKEQYSSDPLRDAFADIFDVITRKFLFSKFGISAYLSTRIRHGVLLGEVRPIFEKYNLISQKDSVSNKYNEINHWNETYRFFDPLPKNKLQSLLAGFSETVDNIIQGLIKDSLQIKTEDENLHGLFDYYFDDTILALHAIKLRDTKDYSEFIRKTIEILWERTDLNLRYIREKIQVEVKAKFNKAIEDLTTNLQTSIIRNIPEVYTNITTCLTDIQNSLDRIAAWFNRSGRQTSDFKLDKLITVVLENVSHSYPKRRLNLTAFEYIDVTIKGEYYTHFADLFRIFLDNALKHSDQTVDSIESQITVEQIMGQLIITIKNAHPDNKSRQEIVDHSNNDINMRKLSTEGKSGFPKADKIIRSDLKNESNSYNVYEDEQGRFTVVMTLLIDNLIA